MVDVNPRFPLSNQELIRKRLNSYHLIHSTRRSRA
jgi:hypothetical protein